MDSPFGWHIFFGRLFTPYIKSEVLARKFACNLSCVYLFFICIVLVLILRSPVYHIFWFVLTTTCVIKESSFHGILSPFTRYASTRYYLSSSISVHKVFCAYIVSSNISQTCSQMLIFRGGFPLVLLLFAFKWAFRVAGCMPVVEFLKLYVVSAQSVISCAFLRGIRQ